jgi:hypothetical protein
VRNRLSGLQQEILTALESWPALEETASGDIGHWAKPGELLRRIGREPTAANRAALSRALLRLYDRGVVARASGHAALVGVSKSLRYVRITDPDNAFTDNAGAAAVVRR